MMIDESHMSRQLKTLVNRIHDLEVQAFQRHQTNEKPLLQAPRPSFAVVKKGEMDNGKLSYTEVLHSNPNDSFSVTEGTFTAPRSGVYSFSFSGTSWCGDNWVGVKVNNNFTLRNDDRDAEWKVDRTTRRLDTTEAGRSSLHLRLRRRTRFTFMLTVTAMRPCGRTFSQVWWKTTIITTASIGRQTFTSLDISWHCKIPDTHKVGISFDFQIKIQFNYIHACRCIFFLKKIYTVHTCK